MPSAHGPMMRVPSASSGAHTFSQVPRVQIERSKFDRSRRYKTTFNEGLLIPVFVDEVLPGDSFHVRMTAFARLTTPIKPLMDDMYLDSFFFFVPTRLLWSHWVNFNGEQANPGDSTAYAVPQLQGPYTAAAGDTCVYMGATRIGQAYQTGDHVSALPIRAFGLIYNNWFRDENLINSLSIPTGDGPDSLSGMGLVTPPRRGKRFDYFTSCLPWPQKGTAVALPLGTLAPVVSDGSSTNFTGITSGAQANLDATTTANPSAARFQAFSGTPTAAEHFRLGTTSAGTQPGTFAGTGLEVDLSSATAATINALRQAFQIQKLLERDARGGTRYPEIIHAHFGVVSPDARLQRPEYLGGGSTPVVISPIAQTSAQTAASPTNQGQNTPGGNLTGVGAAQAHGHGFVKSFTEHGYIIGIVNVRADLTYQDGVDRMWFRQTRYDFYWPAFAHIGEQAVLQQEIFYTGGNAAANTTVFGYQERYGEYRYGRSMVTGLFNSNNGTPLDVWHLAQHFTVAPTLNQAFIEENAPMSRVLALTAEPHFYFDAKFDVRCARPMPVFGVPGFVDHF